MYSIQPVMDDIFIGERKELLYLITAFVVGLYVVKALVRFILDYTLRYIGQKAVAKLRDKLYEKMVYQPIRFFTDNTTGMLISRVTNDVNMIQMSIITLVNIIKDIFTVIFLVGMIFYMNFKLALIAIIAYPFFIHPIVLLSKRIRRYAKKGQEQMGDLTGILQESFSGVRVVKAFAQEKKEVERFEKSNVKVVRFALKAAMANEATAPLMEFASALGIGAIIIIGGSQVINSDLTTGAFFSFFGAIVMAFEPVKRLTKSNSTIQQIHAATERVFEIIDLDNEILDNDGLLNCRARGKELSFKNVSFMYNPEDEPVLRNVSFTAVSGATVAFVGPSGAGKSTIANLIARFYDVAEGGIYIGDTDIRDFKVHSLRENIGYVTQEPFLFNDTVRNNVAYGADSAGFDAIIKACKAAYAHEFIMKLPGGYDTVIGERGTRLSGGQKQRLTIARALLKNAPLLILDEATSSLDTESEREVQKALDNLMKGRTSFVIAHRLSTVINADIIIVLEKGRLIASGKHTHLLETNTLYNSLYLMQEKFHSAL